MKTLRFPLCLALAATTLLSACDKDKVKPANKTELLTGKDWVMTAQTVSPAIRLASGRSITDLYAEMDDCDKDDFLRFEKPSAYTLNDGATKCDPSDPHSFSGSWSFSDGEKVLNTTLQSPDPTEDPVTSSYNIVELKEDGMKLSGIQRHQNQDYTFTFVFRKR